MLIEIADLLDRTALREIREIAERGDFVDGAVTAGYRARRVKNNNQLSKKSAAESGLGARLAGALNGNAEFRRAVLPKRILPPLISRYAEGMAYGAHVDDALMQKPNAVRSDVAVTIFLNDARDYDGGELIIGSPFGEQWVKLPAGAAVAYPASTLHRVAPVERGTRLVAVTWVQSYVRDPQQREILHDLDRVCRKLADSQGEAAETDLAFKSYSNLLRMWSEP